MRVSSVTYFQKYITDEKNIIFGNKLFCHVAEGPFHIRIHVKRMLEISFVHPSQELPYLEKFDDQDQACRE